MTDGNWMLDYVAWKCCESVTLRRTVSGLEDAAIRFLAEPYSPTCRERMKAQLAAARRDMESLSLAETRFDQNAYLSHLKAAAALGNQAKPAAEQPPTPV